MIYLDRLELISRQGQGRIDTMRKGNQQQGGGRAK